MTPSESPLLRASERASVAIAARSYPKMRTLIGLFVREFQRQNTQFSMFIRRRREQQQQATSDSPPPSGCMLPL